MRSRDAGVILGVAFLLLAGCSRIAEQQRVNRELLRTEVRDTPPEGEPGLATHWWFEGDALVVDVDRWRTCHRTRTHVYRHTRVTSRKIVSDTRLTWGLAGGVMAGVGAVFVAKPDIYTPEDAEDPEQTNIILGSLLLSAGVAALTFVIVDSVRAMDSVDDLGERAMPTDERFAYACQEDGGEGLPATLELPGGATLRAQPMGEGRFRFPLGDPRAVMAQPGHTAQLRIGPRADPVPLVFWPPYAALLARPGEGETP